MTTKKDGIQQFNEQLDNFVQNKAIHAEVIDENTPLWALSETLRHADFSDESKIRHSLRQRLMNDLVTQQTPQNRIWSWPRLSLTWLIAVFTVIVAGTILMSIQSNDSPSYSSLIHQPQNTATTEPVLLTLTPMVADTNATIMAMPSVTPGSTSYTYTMPLEDVVITYNISRLNADVYHVVVIATQDIPANTVLEANMMTAVLIPIEFAPPIGYSSVELLVGSTTSTAIPRWSPIESADRGEIVIDSNHIAIAIPYDAPLIDELKSLAEGEHFSIAGTFRFFDIESSDPSIIITLVPSNLDEADIPSVSEEVVSDAVVIWSDYQRDFRGCITEPTAIDIGTNDNIPIVSPVRYPCFITISVPIEDAEILTWALDSQIPMTVGPVESDE